MDYLVLAAILLGVLLLAGVGLVVPRLRRQPPLPPAPPTPPGGLQPDERPPVEQGDRPVGIAVEDRPVAPPAEPDQAPAEPVAPSAPVLERPEPTAGRLVRLRTRLSRS